MTPTLAEMVIVFKDAAEALHGSSADRATQKKINSLTAAWLRAPQRALDGRSPAMLMKSSEEMAVLKSLLADMRDEYAPRP